MGDIQAARCGKISLKAGNLSLQCHSGWTSDRGAFNMSLSLYDFSIPVLLRGLSNLSALLDKAAAHAAAKKFDPLVLAQARLYPDMLPLSRQVQIACDTAKGAAARLAGIEIPKHEDNEVTLADLKQRIAKTLGFSQDGHSPSN